MNHIIRSTNGIYSRFVQKKNNPITRGPTLNGLVIYLNQSQRYLDTQIFVSLIWSKTSVAISKKNIN